MPGEIGRKMRELRDAKNREWGEKVTQAHVAARLNVSDTTVSNVERGREERNDWDEWVKAYADLLYLDKVQTRDLERFVTLASSLPKESPASSATVLDTEQAVSLLRSSIVDNSLLDGTNESFHRFRNNVSEFRRVLAPLLSDEELSHALCCSIQHSVQLPFWTKANGNNVLAAKAVCFHLIEDRGRRTFLRAGWVLQGLNEHSKAIVDHEVRPFFRRMKENGSDLPIRMLDSALDGKIIQFWRDLESQGHEYGMYVDRLVRGISEPED